MGKRAGFGPYDHLVIPVSDGAGVDPLLPACGEPRRSAGKFAHRQLECRNADHHAPILISKGVQKLNPNGMALGIDENAAWVAISQSINAGNL